MDFSDVKRYCTQTLAALDPRTLAEEFRVSKAVLEASMPDSQFDMYSSFEPHEKLAIILKPHFKLVAYLSLVAMIVFASIPLSYLAISAGIGVAFAAILTVGANYIEDPNYFEPSWSKKAWKWLKNE